VQADLCLDEFTDHGHCGVLAADGSVDNDATLEVYARMALAQAEAGADVLGLSGMMDGQVAACRAALDAAGAPRRDVVILAYSAKYASAFYGPFRDAVESTLTGDRRTYQLDPPTGARACRRPSPTSTRAPTSSWSSPPALPRRARRGRGVSTVPVWAYQVSGEYAMIEHAAGGRHRPRACDRRVAPRHPPRRRRGDPDVLGDRGRRLAARRDGARMTDTNDELFARARAVIPGGVDSPVRAYGSVGGTPRFLVGRGRVRDGCRGRRYIDLVASWGPALLGHAHPEVVAVVRAAARGLSFGAPTPPRRSSSRRSCAACPP
jgi:hypothetical protein